MLQSLSPNRKGFAADPFGYSSLAWHKLGFASEIAGYPVDISKPPTAEDLKSPILWLTQAHAMSECARVLFENEPRFESMPVLVRGVCDCQYCAVGLMLIGYSLELCLKAMIIIKEGIESYITSEKSYFHHRLADLANFIPDLSPKEIAILKTLTHFTLWAGRYPDPGSGRVKDAEEIFQLSETHQIAANDVFLLATRIMRHTSTILEQG
jgi:hypothetical protein